MATDPFLNAGMKAAGESSRTAIRSAKKAPHANRAVTKELFTRNDTVRAYADRGTMSGAPDIREWSNWSYPANFRRWYRHPSTVEDTHVDNIMPASVTPTR